ncbi:LOW QUALITY PROTEIN: uncharacterized protein LOC119736999 [Patiria miniata]|uniref:alpha-amylase n=1 Tax=Patiria miniata TaxID=46514 RepID=A0A914ATH5_PATMI|nr:LOW QUALITY PROTEIN: uncharacterized protein LOC119736999 [Patiria miniata]
MARLLLLLLAAMCSAASAQYWDPNMEEGRQVMVNLMAWKWTDIADECERYLGPNGFGGVQISPPNEHAVLEHPYQPWWQRYLPVSYELQSRSGTEDELRDMVNRCNLAGVRIYADVVINHMASGEMAKGSADNLYDPKTLSYPQVPYASEDFSVYNLKCPSKSGGIEDHKNEKEVFNCNLAGLPDLDTSVHHVRYTIAKYMNTLIDIGVAGFRVSNAEHIWPSDLAAIYDSLHDLSTTFFKAGRRPFIFQEVNTVGANADVIKPIEYLEMGSVTEFEFGQIVSEAVGSGGSKMTLSDLGNMEDEFFLIPSSGAVAFVDNPDTQRADAITYKESRLYVVANAFMLAYPYGITRVMSSFDFGSYDEGPPSDESGAILSPIINEDGSCGNWWVCEHRWPPVKNMIAFRNVADGQPLSNWWSNDNQQVAFGRGDKAFIVLNNEKAKFSEFLYTGLPSGEYCDIISGDFDSQSRRCIGPVISVDVNGFATFTLNEGGPPVAAIHVNAIVSDKDTEQIVPDNDSLPPTEAVDVSSPDMKRTTIFIYKPTAYGQNLFLRGGMGEGCTDDCDVPIRHITPGDNAQYNAWKTGDNVLDWYGAEDGQDTYENISAEGTPLVWTTNDQSNGASVATDGYGYTPLNQWGDHYWMVDLEIDCSKTNSGWFELKGFLVNGGWENDVSQDESCQGHPGGNKPSTGGNHFARCGFVNVFKFEESECTIDGYTQEPSEMPSEMTNIPPTPPPIPPIPPTSQIPSSDTTPNQPSADNPSGDETSPSDASAPSSTTERTTIFMYKPTNFGQNLFVRGGLTKDCADDCDVPITHITPGENAQYNAWKTGDNNLDWNGAEEGQNAYENIAAQGTPLVWTTNDPSYAANVDADGYGYTPLNQWGDHYWMVDLEIDCSKTDGGWFELKGFLMNGQGWESDVSQDETCQGSAGGSKPFTSNNHFAICGFVNVFKFDENECTINQYKQESSRAIQSDSGATPSADNPSGDETSPSDASAPSSTTERTTIFMYKPTNFGQNLFVRGGLTKDCADACDVPITHITPGENAQYNAWKTGDNNLDWNGAEEGQNAYENIAAQGTPLVWTTNDPSYAANVDADGYGYTPLNQWGDHYWMVDLEIDCSKTDGGWFELKGFLMNGQGWESDVSQDETCQGSAGGSKPFTSNNHFARCGFVNVFKFDENECTINQYEQESSRAIQSDSGATPSADNPSGDETSPSDASAPSSTTERTTIFMYKPTNFGQNLFVRGGLTKDCADACDVPITHITPGENAQYNAWKTGDNNLDWNGAEEGQNAYENIAAQGTPLVWTTNDPSYAANVDTDGYGYTPLNQWGDHYWMVDLEIDCSKTDSGWFELKGFLMNGQGWETDVSQDETCQGSAGGSKPFTSNNHFARCGFVNVFKFEENECAINEYEQESSRAIQATLAQPQVDNPSGDETSPSDASAPSSTTERTTIFMYKPTNFGQNLFIRGGLTKDCADACDVPITHITPGENAQYNAWKTGDNNLDWNGAEEGQNAYENIAAQGTPLVWTTNDPSYAANVDADGYGYTPLNQWGDHYWMVDLEIDCSKTDGGWFELKGFLMNGQGWESDVSQDETCQGSAGGSKPFTSNNHFARCGFVNVFKFDENECTINQYEQESSRAIQSDSGATPSADNPSGDETSPSDASAPSSTTERTTIFMYKPTNFGQNLFVRGGLTKDCADACDVPITHITPGENAQYNAWKTGDNNLDWNGAEEGQNAYENIAAQGTPLVWTTNDPSYAANVDADGYGYTPLNQWGDHYWMVDLEIDCSKTDGGWFELKGFLMNGQGWETDVSQDETCQGSAGGSKPFTSNNHFARCGFVNVFKFEENECAINEYEQESSRAIQSDSGATPSADNPSGDETSPSDASAPSSTTERTTIFMYKPTNFGQNLFIRGGLTKDCADACDVPITHITPGENAQYNAWKTGDNNLDWNGAEEGQNAYENIAAQGTPLVWTTNDPSYAANVDADGYGYTPLNQWGDHYWMVDLEIDCSKTDGGWFELKGFLMNGQGWESDVSQDETCQGSAGGNKPFTSNNHFARCGFVNVFKFEENECTINQYEQESSRAIQSDSGATPSADNPSGDETSPSDASAPSSTTERTTIFMYKPTNFGQNLFVRGGLTKDCADACDVPITHITPGENAQYNAWKTGDNNLDWNGAEEGQNAYENIAAQGTPLVWTTNDPSYAANVDADGYGYTPLNQWGDHYWMVDLEIDCSKTDGGWFELKGFLMNGQGWETDVSQDETCQGSAGGSKPFTSNNHFARCGFVNVFKFDENECTINQYEQESSRAIQSDSGATPSADNPSGDETSPSDASAPSSTTERTTIFMYKPTNFGQNLFVRGGLTKDCADACDVPITHITPGENAQYNAWKTGDNNLDWNGAEEGQNAYENIAAQGTPLVWTTNDPSYAANVDADGYGYTPLNQWGDHYWMVDLEIDCSKTDGGWFELKGFLMNGQGWESDVSQDETCQGSAGGSKPFTSNNHFARCGFVNVFKFDENECTINQYEQESSRAIQSDSGATPSADNPSGDETSPSDASAASSTTERTTIFMYKPTNFGQNLFVRGGLTKDCADACDVPITHITPGKNAQYNAWKTGDNNLDWNGAEEGQNAYENIAAQGTPLVWTTNDPSYAANVDVDGYGYTPLNQWGDHYWMVDLEIDCSKTDGEWFELKGFLMNGQGWESDVSQDETCQGSAGGSKPFTSNNHFARCGFVNVFKFDENECTINQYEQESSRAIQSDSGATPSADNPSGDETSPSDASAASSTTERTTIFMYKPTNFGQNLFVRGGLTKDCADACDVPITHITPGENAQYNAWKTGDNNLDWNGAEEGQNAYENIAAQGTPLVWTTNDPSYAANVDVDGYGYTPLNQWGDHYWMVDLEIDCSKTDGGWFELKGFLMNGQGWESDVSQDETCQGSAGGSKPFTSNNHFARCGFVNVFKFDENECTINQYEQESSRAIQSDSGATPSADNPSGDETSPSDVSAPSSTTERTTIFMYKPTNFGQNLFVRGGLTKDCADACDVPITHITPGENAQYNAWKTGDNNLDWNGAEEGQNAYENIAAQGTPLVWTTNDPSYAANVDTDGYGYTPLNQWGDHYWMVDLEIDCSKTDGGWFELKGFLMNGQGWETDVSQDDTCQGSAGGSKPFTSNNHFARCGFVNVFKFEENECAINEYEQESSRAIQSDSGATPSADNPSGDETSPSDASAPSSTTERTTIFIYKPTNFGQNLFIRGGLTKDCADACDVPITHITPGENAQYNAWKTGDNNLDWNGAEEGQNAYENIAAQGTPLVWTTNDPSYAANVDADGYGYTPLNQWGDHYWMVDLEIDCSKTDGGWFELKGFLMNGQGWESDVSQDETCQGSAGGSKPFTSNNHFARCGFVNVFKFEENECAINEYEQESSRAIQSDSGATPSADNPSGDETSPSDASAPSSTTERTTIFIYKPTNFGQNLFIRGGLTKDCADACDVPITHITPGENAQYNAWKTGDNNLDWNGAEEGQNAYENIAAQGTPLVWTTNDPSYAANVDTDGYGYTPLNQWGDHYWMVDLEIDCSKTDGGWFELKGFLMNGQGWETDVSQDDTCQGSAGGSKPFTSNNHFARCGFVNVFKFEENECAINEYEQESSRAIQSDSGATPSADNPSGDETSPSDASAPSSTTERTTIFIYKPTNFGQNLFIRGGLTKDCADACDVPITHITPGENAQYNAWKTGDNNLDWNGAEEGQNAYENIAAQGTPLVWTTNDPSYAANVDADGYGYTPLNQWGDHYWMVDLEIDCSKTDGGWFELKGFLMNGQGWESDVSQDETCQGSAGGSKPFTSNNHFARCGFVNVFKFEENECAINEYEQESSRAIQSDSGATPSADNPSGDETSPSDASAPSSTTERTTIFMYKPTNFGQNLFVRGGLTKDCADACDVPITHITPGENAQYNAWKTGDNNLDWNGAEEGQNAYENIAAQGTPLVWTTNDPSYAANVDADGYGYTPLNQWGDHYWMVDLEIDCSKTDGGWFELKGFLMNGQGWESDVSQDETCQGSAGGSKPFTSNNHFARCGFVNVFKFEENECAINEYEQESSRAIQSDSGATPSADNPSGDETSPSDASAPSSTTERTTIFMYKPTNFGQNLFIRGGLTKDCADACDVPITHITPGENAQYNAWKTGDNNLDWNGAEEGQNAYKNIAAQGTPLVWTTNDPSYAANVDTDGYGYTPLNQWGDHYWMVDLEIDCSKTDGGWFELKGFLMNGQGWESDVSQDETCQGSAGGSKPFTSNNHFARCGFVNVFKFEENECAINEYEQESSRAIQSDSGATPSADNPSGDETSPSDASAPSSTTERTTIFMYKPTNFGQNLFVRGGLTKDCADACDVPITHITSGENAQYNAWKTGDNNLDWNGAEEGQNAYENIAAQGTPLVWTTNDPSYAANMDADGYGYTPLNQWGDHYWMVDLEIDCSKTDGGWFELKGFLMNGQGWESDVSQDETCQGSAGGSKPFTSINHFARCGFVNVFKFEESECTINQYEQESSRAIQSDSGATPSADNPSGDETSPSDASAPSSTTERTTIFMYKLAYFGQNLFIRGGATEGCTEACTVPIIHVTPGNNPQYNAWKTGDAILDWYGAEEGQNSYENIPAEGTPLIWTTNDKNSIANVATDGFGYTPLNQWGDHYWMVDLEMDCSKTDGGWFELKGFLMNGEGWESDVSQIESCEGSAGGSKPFTSNNHFARCGFINVFKFAENGCIIDTL